MTCSVRGVRGATTCDSNSEQDILSSTAELLQRMVAVNEIRAEDVGSAIFTVSPDLTAAFPAKAARGLGWVNVPLMCAQEIPVPGSPRACIRVLLHWNTDKGQDDVVHVYLRGARVLRPDLSGVAVPEAEGESEERE